jgi:NAD-specific glutamate dehydrogenase
VVQSAQKERHGPINSRGNEIMAQEITLTEVETLSRRLPVAAQWELLQHLTQRLSRTVDWHPATAWPAAIPASKLETQARRIHELTRQFQQSLLEAARFRFPAETEERVQQLLDKGSADTLTAEEEAELEQLLAEIHHRDLEKARALAALAQQGIPPAEVLGEEP